MATIELKVNKREITGKKVRFLRGEGITPVHLFGHNVESLALQTETSQLQRVLTQAGKTKLIDLTLEKARKPRKVITREIQRNPLTGELLHVDFYEVSMEEKIRMEIPIVLVGESPALKIKDNILAHELHTLDIECLPDAIPSRIELDVSCLTEADQSIRVKDIVLGKEITVLNNPDVVAVRIGVRKIEEEVKPPEAVEAEAAAAEVPVTGEKPAEEAKEEKAKEE
jgi:large subunit ribosomal protein L25